MSDDEKKMKKWNCYASVVGTKFLGTVEAESEMAAGELAGDLDSAYVCLCHKCSSECEDAEVDTISVERAP